MLDINEESASRGTQTSVQYIVMIRMCACSIIEHEDWPSVTFFATFQFVVDTCIVPTNMHPHMKTLLRDHVLFSYVGLSVKASQTIIASEEPISEPPFD